jgi:hypothetical protein
MPMFMCRTNGTHGNFVSNCVTIDRFSMSSEFISLHQREAKVQLLCISGLGSRVEDLPTYKVLVS